jgi:hypothetical protein
MALLLRLRGPHAFVFWHAASRCVFVARDPLGRRSLLVRQTASQLVITSCAPTQASAYRSDAAAPVLAPSESALPAPPGPEHADPGSIGDHPSVPAALGTAAATSEDKSAGFRELPPGLYTVYAASGAAHLCHHQVSNAGSHEVVLAQGGTETDQDGNPAPGIGWKSCCLSTGEKYESWQRILHQYRPAALVHTDGPHGSAEVEGQLHDMGKGPKKYAAKKGGSSARVLEMRSVEGMGAEALLEQRAPTSCATVRCLRQCSSAHNGAVDAVMTALQQAVHTRCSAINASATRQAAWCAPRCACSCVRNTVEQETEPSQQGNDHRSPEHEKNRLAKPRAEMTPQWMHICVCCRLLS